MDQKLRERLMVTYGYLRGLDGKVLGTGMFGSVERAYVPRDVIEPLQDLLFPEGDTIKIKTPPRYTPEEGNNHVSK